MEKDKKSAAPVFDTSGRYEGGLNSLVKSLQWAFGVLLVLIVLMLIYFFSWGGYFSVEPQQEVIVMRFGRIHATHKSGAHWYFPYPVHRFIRVQTNPQFLKIEFQQSQKDPGEVKDAFEPGMDNYLITGDENVVLTSWTLGYKISDAEKYYKTLATPEKPVVNGRIAEDDEVVDADGFSGRRGPRTLLRNLFRQAVVSVSATSKVDDMLRSGQAQYTESVQREFARLLKAADCGIELESVVLDQVLPPSKTKEAFAEVTAASTTQSTRQNEAEAYRNKVINEAAAQAAKVEAEADTYKTRTIASIEAEKEYFVSILREYNRTPDSRSVQMVLYNTALADAFADIQDEKFVLNSGGRDRQLWLKLNPEPKRPAEQDKKKPEK